MRKKLTSNKGLVSLIAFLVKILAVGISASAREARSKVVKAVKTILVLVADFSQCFSIKSLLGLLILVLELLYPQSQLITMS